MRASLVALVAALVVAAPAQAQVTGSHITAPADPQFILYDTDAAHPATVNIAGTAAGSGSVDIVCVSGNTVTPVVDGVAVQPNGTFAFADAPLDQVADAGNPEDVGQTCRLHAVPAGTTPSDLGPYTGPRLGVSKLSRIRLDSTAAPNTGIVWDYYLYAAGIGAAADLTSFGSCGIYDSYIADPATLANELYGTYCDGFPLWTRSTWGLSVDHQPAYAPGSLGGGTGGQIGLQPTPGFPSLTVGTPHLDPRTGDLSVSETNPLVKCDPDDSYPPTFEKCTSFVTTHVRLDRTTDLTHNGQVIKVTDRYVSTDGAVHSLDVALDQNVCLDVLSGTCSGPFAYRFPGESGYTAHSGSIAGPLPAAQPILAEDTTTPAHGGAALIPGQYADGATFAGDAEYTLDYRSRTIPASGGLTLVHYYVTGRTPTEAEQLAAAVTSSLQPPPHGGGSTPTPTPTPSPTPTPTPRPTPTPTPTPSPGHKPAAKPRILRHGKVHVRRAGKTFVVVTGYRVKCPAGSAACKTRVRGTSHVAGHHVRMGTTKRRIAAGRHADLRLRLRLKGARVLKAHRHLRMSLAVSASNGSGKPVRRSRTVRIRAVAHRGRPEAT